MIGKTNSQTGGARGENLNITLTSNQTDKSDLIGATVTVSYGDETVEQVWNGSVIVVKVPQYVGYTVAVSAIEGYSQPSHYSGTASNQNNSLPLTFTYNTEVVSVSLSADDNSSVNGAQVEINGTIHTWNGTAITQKVPFGTIYSVVPQALSGYSTPASQTGIVASQSSRNLSFTYIASALKVIIFSNQDNDSTIAAVKATVAYGSTSVQVSNGEQVSVPANTAVTITFPEVENYKTPDPISFTYTGGLSEKSGTYKCELLTVNVTADSGTPTGFEVTISKQETVGVVTKYTRLKYIESNGTQYIDTGFKPNQSTAIVFHAYNNSESSSGWTYGSYHSETSNLFCFATRHGTTNFGYGDGRIAIGTVPVGEFTASLSQGTYQLVVPNSPSLNILAGFGNKTFSSSYNIYLFAINAAGKASSGRFHGKLYSCKIYDNGTLVRDYIPALRSDGIAGLYDAVHDTFYASSGSGNFTFNSDYQEVIATQTSVTGSYKIPFDTSYVVQAGKVNGYDTPQSVARVASAKSYTVTQQYKVITVRDLSLYDVYGNSINRSTANCYIVREAGKYKFPLVYGNAIKNGQVNTAAFTNNGGAYSHDFNNSYNNVIDSPYIETYDDVRKDVVYLSDSENVISDIEVVDGSPCKYVQFTINSVPQSGGNVIISPLYGIGSICWNWHIWLWPHDLSPVEITNSTGVKYNIMPVNLASKYDSDLVHIKNWFYQWGRPNPMLLPSAYNSSTNHATFGTISHTDPIAKGSDDWSGNMGIATGIIMPHTFFYNTSSPYNWFGTQSYYNLWDAACTETGNSDNDTVKTVYDPCPVGWKVPNGNTFTGLSIINNANGIVKMARYSGDTTGVEFPLSGYRSYADGSFHGADSDGYVWLSSAHSQSNACHLRLASNNVGSQFVSLRAEGYSIRPVQDDNIQLEVIYT